MKKVILKIVLIIILKESELIHTTLYLLKTLLTFHSVIMLIKSVIDKNSNNYYYSIFLEKGSYKDKYNAEYLKMKVCIS